MAEYTSDYKGKLHDLDRTYYDKKHDLDRQRAEIERTVDMARGIAVPEDLDFNSVEGKPVVGLNLAHKEPVSKKDK